MQFRPGLQGLRGLAILLVVAQHVDLLPGGWVGVDVFFALSGFLITRILIERPSGLPLFYARRARRLLPALFTVLMAVAVIGGSATLPDVLNGATYRTNLEQPHGLLTHLWSLAQEEQFYLLWPAVLLATPQRYRLCLALTLVGFGATHLVVAALGGADSTRLYYMPDTHALPMLLGCVLALCEWRPSGRLAAVIGVAGLAIAAEAGLQTTLSPMHYAGVECVSAVASAALVVVALGEWRLLRAQSLQRLGLYSYGLYLWHYPLIIWLPNALAIPLALAMAVTSYHAIELPIRRGKLPRLAFA